MLTLIIITPNINAKLTDESSRLLTNSDDISQEEWQHFSQALASKACEEYYMSCENGYIYSEQCGCYHLLTNGKVTKTILAEKINMQDLKTILLTRKKLDPLDIMINKAINFLGLITDNTTQNNIYYLVDKEDFIPSSEEVGLVSQVEHVPLENYLQKKLKKNKQRRKK